MAKIRFHHASPHPVDRSYKLIENYIQGLDGEYNPKGYHLEACYEKKCLVLKEKSFTAKLQIELGATESTSRITIDIKLPFTALMFKNKIQKELSSHLKKALHREEPDFVP